MAGSFLNLSAVIQFLKEDKKDCILFCSGWKDQFSYEDTLFAGAVIEGLQVYFDWNNDSAYCAYTLYQAAKNDLYSSIKKSSHYQRLSSHGVEKDILFCISLNKFDILPYLNTQNQLII